MKVSVVRNILEANHRIAEENRALFKEHGIFVLNLMSSPGAGKTTLLERTIEGLRDEFKIGVIEGDLQTTADADRVAAAGAEAVQINTDGACHLDSNMIKEALGSLALKELDILIIENVGNLVCPAEFYLGEDQKIMILSVAEGDDKPAKYPVMFQKSSALLVNKVDLLPYVDFDMKKVHDTVIGINPNMTIFEVSCRTGYGLDAWLAWLRNRTV
ncbi:MAG: hydrogenase nickel incorporation protein HypB [Pseudomonadota bacterium]